MILFSHLRKNEKLEVEPQKVSRVSPLYYGPHKRRGMEYLTFYYPTKDICTFSLDFDLLFVRNTLKGIILWNHHANVLEVILK
jgi:hypothetical protein